MRTGFAVLIKSPSMVLRYHFVIRNSKVDLNSFEQIVFKFEFIPLAYSITSAVSNSSL